MLFQGFKAFIDENSKILILGSFPSVKSREEGFYYGNRQNRFWKVVSKAFGAPLPQTVAEKKALLAANGIALWDVVTACEIRGSMDKDIRNPQIADLDSLTAKYALKAMITNGGTAQALLQKHFPHLAEKSIALPSTSPANTRLNENLWVETLIRLSQ